MQLSSPYGGHLLLKLAFPGHKLDHSNRTQNLIHDSRTLVPSGHQIFLSVDDDFAGIVIERDGNCQAYTK